MSAFKKNPVFASVLTVLAVLALGEVWCIYERHAAAQAAAGVLAQKKLELQAMAALVPAPTRVVAAAVEADLARGQRTLEAMEAELKGRGPAAERLRTARHPTTRTDAYFDLATFVEQTRALAKKQEVELKPEAVRFGFATYANEGPETDRVPAVFQQRLVAQYLLEALFEARPRALLSVQRERVLTKTEREARDAALQAAKDAAAGGQATAPVLDGTFASTPDGPDFFAIDPRASARVPGAVDTTAFRIAFTGQTAALRAFLNQLAGFELPMLVREVEVVPASGEEAAAAAPAEETAAPAESAPASIVLTTDASTPRAGAAKPVPKTPGIPPIVAKPLSKFTVTVEYIALVPPPASAAPEAETGAAKPTT
jgi:hypothetical protein